jgi:hypothetical protein
MAVLVNACRGDLRPAELIPSGPHGSRDKREDDGKRGEREPAPHPVIAALVAAIHAFIDPGTTSAADGEA